MIINDWLDFTPQERAATIKFLEAEMETLRGYDAWKTTEPDYDAYEEPEFDEEEEADDPCADDGFGDY